jgi:hypothetical protein
MLMRLVTVVAVILQVIWASGAAASCRRVTVPEIVGVAVFKHYRHDGGEVVDVVINNDVVLYYRGLGSKAKVRKLQLAKVRQAGWVPKSVLSQQRVPCVSRPAPGQPGEIAQGAPFLFDWFQLLFDRFKPL